MPRYFFDIHTGSSFVRDTFGIECAGRKDVRREIMSALPAIARDEIPKDGDCQAFNVLVRDENDLTVYTATLMFAAQWIGEVPIPRLEEDVVDYC